ncbi:CUN063 hypothetical protein [Culex nigripalpus nucleopolyhedrovirus]|uniref:Uncharacterized protein n=1 Tax=Culex nigripalpus nucleopolyhedrovirus (isolate Florida/1997) TaxID=645993 RepID=Q919L3_NPVCO|nr:CUN063 hypothetical protein [Culex nigripalpus nucleopolyhedrovirus]AAK94141.1 CUN063 hypothetical protein [Culex nigripalpus nucleopolyhedrovirus]
MIPVRQTRIYRVQFAPLVCNKLRWKNAMIFYKNFNYKVSSSSPAKLVLDQYIILHRGVKYYVRAWNGTYISYQDVVANFNPNWAFPRVVELAQLVGKPMESHLMVSAKQVENLLMQDLVVEERNMEQDMEH